MKLADYRRQNAERGGRQRADTHHVGVHSLFAVERLTRGIERVEDLYRVGEKLLPNQRQLRAQPPALKKPRSGQLLQLVERFDKAG